VVPGGSAARPGWGRVLEVGMGSGIPGRYPRQGFRAATEARLAGLINKIK